MINFINCEYIYRKLGQMSGRSTSLADLFQRFQAEAGKFDHDEIMRKFRESLDLDVDDATFVDFAKSVESPRSSRLFNDYVPMTPFNSGVFTSVEASNDLERMRHAYTSPPPPNSVDLDGFKEQSSFSK